MNASTSLLLCLSVSMPGCAAGLGLIDVGSTRTSSSEVITSSKKTGTTDYGADTYEYTTGTMKMSGGGFGVMTGVHAGGHFSSFGDEHESESGWLVDALVEIVGSSGWWGFGLRFDYLFRFADRQDYGGLPMTGHFYVGGEKVSGHIGAGVDLLDTSFMRLMTGVRFAISSDSDGATLLVLDIDHIRGDTDRVSYSSTGLIVGLAFLQ